MFDLESHFELHFQIGDLKGLFGLLMVHMQMLRAKLKVLDVSYGTGTGKFSLVCNFFLKCNDSVAIVKTTFLLQLKKCYSNFSFCFELYLFFMLHGLFFVRY
jgi:hypothetical protein